MSDNKLVKTIMDAATDWLSRQHRLGKQKGLERRLNS